MTIIDMKRHIVSFLSLLPALSPLGLGAQSVEVKGILPVGSSQEIVASIDLNGKTVKSVTSYAYDMTTGYNLTGSTYALVENKYLNVTVPTVANASAYRLAVTFTDGTTTLSPVLEPATGERFMWLGDYAWTSAVCGWSGYSTQVDRAVDSSKKFRIGDIIYYKGVAGHAEGSIAYTFASAPFVSFRSTVGLMFDEVNGDVRYRIATNGTEVENFVVYSAANTTGIGTTGIVSKEVNVNMTGVTALNFTFNIWDSNNWGDQVLMALARLYLPKQTTAAKQPQTVTMLNTGGLTNDKQITLQATASSGDPVYYRIAEGASLATINGNVLTFVNGATGSVTVEACTYGNDTYDCANAFVTFKVNRGMSLLAQRAFVGESGTQRYLYLFLDAQDTPLTSLYMQTYDNAAQLNAASKIDLKPYLTDTTFKTSQVIELPISTTAFPGACRVMGLAKGASAEKALTDYLDGGLPFVCMSDLTVTSTHTYGTLYKDVAYGGSGQIYICGQYYAKGFGMHATSTVTTTVNPTDYTRFAADAGKYYGKSGYIEALLYFNGKLKHTTGPILSTAKASWDYQLNDTVSTVMVKIDVGGDGNSYDWGEVGGPRFYRKTVTKNPQSLTWTASHVFHEVDTFSVALDAVSSAGLPVDYKLVSGGKYANISNGQLHVTAIPDKDSIVVEAYQPGSSAYAAATPVRSTYKLLRGYSVKKGERLELNGNQEIEELVIYGDVEGVGEVVANGLINVRHYVLKFTFVPRDWYFFSFPTEVNIDQISDLNTIGYKLNAGSKVPTYYIRKYSGERRASAASGHTGWYTSTEPTVGAQEGFLIGINDKLGLTPREVTFRLDNVQLTLDGDIKVLDLSLDLTNAEPGAKIPVYITSSNVSSNTLKVEVEYEPSDLASLPLNYERALSDTRVVGIPGGNGVRLTLPTQEKARVFILDKKMQNVLKAVRYVAPMVLDISDLASGTYPMVVEYGNARRVMEVTKK